MTDIAQVAAAQVSPDVTVEDLAEQTFADFGVSEEITSALAAKGIEHPFPIQALTLPVALTGADIIGQAKTGTGKTLGFGIPLLQRVTGPEEDGFTGEAAGRSPQALVVVPTRELAKQVADDFLVASANRNISIVTIYGGKDFDPQIASLKAGADVVVGTPGRLLDLYGRRVLKLDAVRTVVLDEADEMLDLGFLPDVERIIAAVPPVRQTMLFSATMPGAVITMARRYMSKPTHIRTQDPDDQGTTAKNVKQFVYRAHSMDKSELVARALQAEGRGKTIIFARTKRTADRLAEELVDRGFEARPLHGDLNQQARERALKQFREGGGVDILVATDVAARGIDIDDVTHVFNYQCPDDEKTYIHRIGRTGRAGRTGVAITLVDWDDMPKWRLVNKALDLDFDEPAETYSSSPHLFTDLGIPEGTKGRLRRRKPAAGEDSSGDRRERGERKPARGGSRRAGSDRRSASSRSAGDAPKGEATKSGDRDTEAPRRSRTRRRTRSGKPSGHTARAERGDAPAAE
ncbi:DEAD/DEAH box helicase [Brevibacterium samyangense]|uniref:RNA helicase n=1 Tax=Brevibacterium samyangense TaxID=366888 RepID=A0ABN2TA47_9MICO